MDLNKVMFAGRLTRDPQTKYLPSGQAVAEFGVVCNRRWRTPQGEDREEATFVDAVAFAKTAETIAKFFRKGKPILLEARLKYDTWEDKQNGGKRSKISLVVERFHFVGNDRDGGEAEPATAGAGGGHKPRSGPVEPPFGEEPQFADPDIPFFWQGRRGQAI